MQSKNSKQFKSGFTLIELLVVIAIVGILAGLAVVSMSGAVDRAKIVKSMNFSTSIKHKLSLSCMGDWNFDEGSGTAVVDFSGNNNNGTISGGASYSTSTPSGNGINGEYSLSFDGSDDFVSTPEIVFPGEYTLEFWVFRRSTTPYHFVLGHGSLPGKFGFNNGSDTLFVRPNDAGSGGATSVSAPSNQWIHIAVARDVGNVIRAYVNGAENILFGGAAQSGTLTINRIGTDAGGGWKFYGLIDEVKVYSQSLSSFDIRNDYFAGLDRLLASKQISMESYNKMISNLGYVQNEQL